MDISATGEVDTPATAMEGSTAANPGEENDQVPVVPCVLDQPEEISDLILEVEGRQLHTSRAVLAHYSPVFRRMLYSDFKEKDQKTIPLPGKKISDIAVFFNVMFPAIVGSSCLVNDENILSLLALADEYEVQQVKIACQDYIGSQLASYHRRFYEIWTSWPPANQIFVAQVNVQTFYDKPGRVVGLNPPAGRDSIVEVESPERQAWIDKFLLYTRACNEYDLPHHKEEVKQMVVMLCRNTNNAFKSALYAGVPPLAKNELLEDLCRKFESKQI